MKCPKCGYLGFETGDKCKYCGYDFSLMAPAAATDRLGDLSLRDDARDDLPASWLDELDTRLGGFAPEGDSRPPVTTPPAGVMPPPRSAPRPPAARAVRAATPPAASVTPRAVPPVAGRGASTTPAARVTPVRVTPPPSNEPRIDPSAFDIEPPRLSTGFRGEPALPLFPPVPGDDRPLVTLPAAPRPPLAVRRTPDVPRLRTVAKPLEREVPVPALDFVDDVMPVPPAATASTAPRVWEVSAGGPRLAAALLDHALLSAIDVIVVYFTLRMAALETEQWYLLPLAPIAAFLGLFKMIYFAAFTAVGGQTIGKMALHLRVVGDDHRPVTPPQALQRAIGGAFSMLTAGIGFLPALFGSDHRALHDRIARTRVVARPSA